ncbi:MAG: cytochrome c3 family protein [Planctomycetota bacterium]
MTVNFPKWTNKLPTIVALAVVFGGLVVTGIVWYFGSPKFTDVGYSPTQPIAYSHKLHAGVMAMDCRYCHTSVEQGPHANVPPTEVCMNCHKTVLAETSDQIKKLVVAHNAGQPVAWQKVHLLPDYAFFNHAAHVRVGVGCARCHGRVDQLEEVRQVEPLSMGWCLACHRDPKTAIRPTDKVTDMNYAVDPAVAERLIEEKKINPPTHCSACHR